LGQSVTDPSISLARTQSEQLLVASLLQRGATISYDFEHGIPVVRGGTVPTTDQELIPVLSGTLNFVMRWQDNTDLNLGVLAPPTASSPGGSTVYPLSGLNHTTNGGRIAFDHRGGPNGGIEVCSWPASFPDGIYAAGVVY